MKTVKIDESFEISQVVAGCMRAADKNMQGGFSSEICGRMHGHGSDNF